MSSSNRKKRLVSDFFGGKSDGRGGKKAKASSPTTQKKIVFLVCPGAGGSLPKDGTLEKQLGSLGRVAVIPKQSSTGLKYSGMRGCVAPAKSSSALNDNLQILQDNIAQELGGGDDKVELILVGQSFGCRAIVHWLCANHEVRKPPSVPVDWSDEATPDQYQDLRARIKTVLLFGYPLIKDNQDRSAALKLLPQDIRACFVIGTQDTMALTGKDAKAKKKFKDVLEETPATTEVIWVEGGGHSPPNNKKWTEMDLTNKLKAFINAATE